MRYSNFSMGMPKIKTLHKSDRNLFMQIPVTNEEIKQKYLMVKFKSHNILKLSRR